jgi:hypothetical protein
MYFFQYQAVEDPVRRKVKNSLTAGSSIKGQAQLKLRMNIDLVWDFSLYEA